MSSLLFFAAVGVLLWLLGLGGLLLARSALRRIIAVNIMAGGAFMVMVTLAARGAEPDPVLQALVVTGLVVGVSATAFAVRLHRALAQAGRERDESGARHGEERP